MSKIKKMPKKDFKDFIDIISNAFPGFGVNSPEEKKRALDRIWKVQKEDPDVNVFGIYNKEKLLGGIRLFDFTMNYASNKIPVGGGGLLAIDLIHKKEHTAKKLMEYYLDYYKKKNTAVAALYPFRPDFYRKMGFGYGTKTSQYTIKPGDLPRGNSKKHIQFLTKNEARAMIACYKRIADKTHGMFEILHYETTRFKAPSFKMVGYKSGRKVLGYIRFEFKKIKTENMIFNNLHIHEMIYENREVLSELLAFLHSQADQINQIIYSTKTDFFHFVPFDPRDGSDNTVGGLNHQCNVQGVGIMYKVFDIKKLFQQLKHHNFNDQNCRLKLNVTDSFTKENNSTHIVHFIDGKPNVKSKANFEVEISIDISDFSSMVMGVVSFKQLYQYNLADISNIKYLEKVNDIFASVERPVCTTQF